MSAIKFVPKGFSETDDFFAGVMVDAPEFSMNGMSVAQAFEKLESGIDSVIAKAKQPKATEYLVKCKEELVAVRDMFLSNTGADPELRKSARMRLQRAYYDLYRKAGQLLKPGADIGPDDDI
jgi:hypothetical protein